MCDYCKMWRCPTGCPNAARDELVRGQWLGVCAVCGIRIYENDAHFARGRDFVCAECGTP